MSARLLNPKGVEKLLVLAAGIWLASASPAQAVNHAWRIQEVFSNADGTVQYIELRESLGSTNENRLSKGSFFTDANTYPYPYDIPGNTLDKTLLMATQGFADLPGAPTPDYIIPDQFFDPAGDTLIYCIYDTLVLPPGVLPTDGVHAMGHALVPVLNSPTNFAGATATIGVANVPLAPGGPGRFALLFASALLLALGLAARRARTAQRRGAR